MALRQVRGKILDDVIPVITGRKGVQYRSVDPITKL